MKKDKFITIMNMGIKEIGLNADEKIINDYWVYMNFLLQENKKYNLSGIREEKGVIYKHFFDSLAPLTCLNIKENDKIMDMGTGAGFPGFVVKIYFSKLKTVLVDSTLKKINFLQLLSVKLNLTEDLDLIHERAEKLAKEKRYRASFDYVFSRAVAPLNILTEYTLPFVKRGGNTVYYKGPEYKNELKEAEKSLQILGGEINDIRQLKVPGLKGQRFLVLVKKKHTTPVSYPRRVGMPKKRPL